MCGNPDVGNFPACGSPGLVTPGLRRRRAYRRAYVASPRLTTTDVGLTPRLALDILKRFRSDRRGQNVKQV